MFNAEIRRKIGRKLLNRSAIDKSRAFYCIQYSFIHFGFYLMILGPGVNHLDGTHEKENLKLKHLKAGQKGQMGHKSHCYESLTDMTHLTYLTYLTCMTSLPFAAQK